MENLREYLEERRTTLEKKLKNEQESLRRVSREMDCTRACLAEVEAILALDEVPEQYYVVQTSFSQYPGEWGPWEDTAFIFKTLAEAEKKANEITSSGRGPKLIQARARLKTTE